MTISYVDNWLHVIEVGILALGAFFAIRQLQVQHAEAKSIALREYRRHSMEIDTRLAELAAERQRVEAMFPPSDWTAPIPLELLQSAFQADGQLEPALLRLIEQMELLALPVCAKAADEDMAFELVGATLVKYSMTFRRYIEYRRASQGRPDFYVYLTTLVDERWEARDNRERRLISRGTPPFFMR
jgi:hypothetical protein